MTFVFKNDFPSLDLAQQKCDELNLLDGSPMNFPVLFFDGKPYTIRRGATFLLKTKRLWKSGRLSYRIQRSTNRKPIGRP